MRKGLAALICLWLCHCSEPEPGKQKLEIQDSSPITLTVGDTTSVLVVSRTTFDKTGRTVTEKSYVSYSLTVADSAIAKVALGHRLVGLAPGETSVKASDDKTTLVSDAVTIKVVAKP